MSPWTAAALVLLLGFIPCGLVVLKGSLAERLVALQLAAVITVLILLLMAQSVARASFEDLALVLALLSFPSALLFAHYLERTR